MTCEQTTGPSELKGVSTGAASGRPRSSAGAPTRVRLPCSLQQAPPNAPPPRAAGWPSARRGRRPASVRGGLARCSVLQVLGGFCASAPHPVSLP